MAEIVGALGVPHNPFTALALARGEEAAADARRLYGALAAELRAMAPDTIVIVTSDHYNLFFELSVPIFSIAVAERAAGPCDYPQLPRVDAALDAELAREIQAALVAQEFDVGATRELELDHTITAPLGAMLGEVNVPLIALYVSGSMHPLPSARRCFALGHALGRAIEDSPLERRVVVIASGAFSFEVGGPLMSEDSHVGVPDVEWALRVTDLLGSGEFERVVEEATPAQLAAAGNASGELLDWLVMLGAFRACRPVFIEAQPQEGHAFAAWRLAP